MSHSLHINLDDAWDSARLPAGIPSLDARDLGPHLRYTASHDRLQKAFDVLRAALPQNHALLYGSGDFHHLAALWLQAALQPKSAAPPANVTLLSFDNHPDWDIRPPRWGCGGWINRALEYPQISRAEVWGCGNFELAFPARLFRNRRALAAGKLKIHAWAERQSPATARRFDCMTRLNWRERFHDFARSVNAEPLYITLDMDALASQHAVTNWENGLFTAEDLVHALTELKTAGAQVIGIDCCGAWSPPVYARKTQRWMGNFDHPHLAPRTLESAREINHRTLATLWTALTALLP